MLHRDRRWGLGKGLTDEEIVSYFTEHHSLVACTAFETAAGTIWANDSTSEDAIQEYAVLRADPVERDRLRQVESISVSWCDAAELRTYIEQADAGAFDAEAFDVVDRDRFDVAHGPCPHCR